MPIYAYKCESCGHAKDVLQKMSDPLLTVCPVCGAPAFKKQVTAAGFQLKGSGWYATDFKGGGASATPTGEKSNGDGDSKGDSKADSKNDAKADSKSSDAKTESKPATPAQAGTASQPASKPAVGGAPAGTSAG